MNLPQNFIKKCIVGDLTISEDFNRLGIKTIITKPTLLLPKPVCTHPDMIFHYLDSKHLYSIYQTDYIDSIKISENAKNYYPYDILLNAARIGENIICNSKYTAKEILVGNIIDVKQGYAKCSTLVIDENSIVTSDSSIANAWIGDVLHIQSGYINLAGYNYGFIGGCGGKLDKNTLYLTANTHPEINQITAFAKERNVDIIFGSYPILTDVGSIIPIL
ncbi:MAG: hypothetical protein RSE93_03105 [Oscillospiraceae bacterium]